MTSSPAKPVPRTPTRKPRPPFRPAGINTTPTRTDKMRPYKPTLRRSTKDVGTASRVRINSPQMIDINSRDELPNIYIPSSEYHIGKTTSPTSRSYVLRPGPYAKNPPSLLESTSSRSGSHSRQLQSSLTQSKPLTTPPRQSSLSFHARTSPNLVPKVAQKTNLPLPQEIRDQILSYLLTMAAGPVEYLPPAIRRSRATYLKAYGRQLPPLSQHQVKLRKNYFSLILTSRSVKADATRMLFQFNEWFVRISLVRDLLPEGLSGRQVGLLRGRNGVNELERTFGPDVFSYVRNLRVKVVSESKREEREIMTYLASLAYRLSAQPRSLKFLTIEWSNYYSVPSHDSPQVRKNQVKYCRSRRRDSSGTYRRVATPWHWCMWENEETILRPLLKVRNVPLVKVMGNVSVQWATYLESVMMGEEGPVDKFVRHESMAEFK